jgi:hypothetical protein
MDHFNDDLIGNYVHSYEAGEIGYQGKVLDVTGGKVRIQLFSWRTGWPADVVPFTKAFVAKHCKLYTPAEFEDWRITGESEMAASQYWRRWHRPAEKPQAGAFA